VGQSARCVAHYTYIGNGFHGEGSGLDIDVGCVAIDALPSRRRQQEN
jgi:hypothetical protein